MALLLETDWGDLVIDLDVSGSPDLCKNILKLAKARFYTNTLIYSVTPQRFCQAGCPVGDGSGGTSIYGLLDKVGDYTKSKYRFLKSEGRPLSTKERQERGRVVACPLQGVPDTIGSQFLITLGEGPDQALDGYEMAAPDGEDRKHMPFLSLGTVAEDENGVLDKIAAAYADPEGRPYADIRIIRVLVVDDPFDDPNGMGKLLEQRGVVFDGDRVTDSPSPERPPEETVEVRISIAEVTEDDDEEDIAKVRERQKEVARREDRSRAVVLEMLGDLPDADIKAPENVLFICKLNPITQDEDLELIFSRFDNNVKVEVIRDQDSGDSLQYAFAEFGTKQAAVEAYFKMNNALVDDRRIKVDFSQSVSKVWDKYNQRLRMPRAGPGGSFGGGPSSTPKTGGDRSSQHPRKQDSRGGGVKHSSHHPHKDGHSRDSREHHNNHEQQQRFDRESGPRDEFGRQTDWRRSAGQPSVNRQRDHRRHDDSARHRDRNDRERSRSYHGDSIREEQHRERKKRRHDSDEDSPSQADRRHHARESGSRQRERHHEHEGGRYRERETEYRRHPNTHRERKHDEREDLGRDREYLPKEDQHNRKSHKRSRHEDKDRERPRTDSSELHDRSDERRDKKRRHDSDAEDEARSRHRHDGRSKARRNTDDYSGEDERHRKRERKHKHRSRDDDGRDKRRGRDDDGEEGHRHRSREEDDGRDKRRGRDGDGEERRIRDEEEHQRHSGREDGEDRRRHHGRDEEEERHRHRRREDDGASRKRRSREDDNDESHRRRSKDRDGDRRKHRSRHDEEGRRRRRSRSNS